MDCKGARFKFKHLTANKCGAIAFKKNKEVATAGNEIDSGMFCIRDNSGDPLWLGRGGR